MKVKQKSKKKSSHIKYSFETQSKIEFFTGGKKCLEFRLLNNFYKHLHLNCGSFRVISNSQRVISKLRDFSLLMMLL